MGLLSRSFLRLTLVLLPWAGVRSQNISTDKDSYAVGEQIAISWNYSNQDAANCDWYVVDIFLPFSFVVHILFLINFIVTGSEFILTHLSSLGPFLQTAKCGYS